MPMTFLLYQLARDVYQKDQKQYQLCCSGSLAHALAEGCGA
jgi:hypothetical protein